MIIATAFAETCSKECVLCEQVGSAHLPSVRYHGIAVSCLSSRGDALAMLREDVSPAIQSGRDGPNGLHHIARSRKAHC